MAKPAILFNLPLADLYLVHTSIHGGASSCWPWHGPRHVRSLYLGWDARVPFATFAWLMFHGKPRPGRTIKNRRACEPGCVRPDHLREVTVGPKPDRRARRNRANRRYYRKTHPRRPKWMSRTASWPPPRVGE